MNALSKFLSAGSFAFLAATSSSFAVDTDPGYNPGAGGVGSAGSKSSRGNRYAPEYLRPTQRYYGKGYTVAYRFIPWSDRMRSLNATSMWDSEQMRLPANAAATTSTNGNSPRITYFYKKAASPAAPPPPPASGTGTAPLTPSTGILPERNSSTADTPKSLPPIGEAPKK